MGIWIAFAQGGVQRPLSKKYKPTQILKYSSILLAIALPTLLIPEKPIWIYAIVPIIAILQGLTQPNSTAIVSELGDEKTQGEILGINQSVQSLAQAIPPIVAGFLTSINISLPIVIGGVSIAIAWLIFRFFFLNRREEYETENTVVREV